MIIDIPLEQITEGHLQSLVTDRVAEDRQLEYKLTLPTKERAEVKEFLKDVSALANTIGGDIIYGMKEGKDSSGNTVAVSLNGIAGVDINEVVLRLEDIIRNGIKLRLIGVKIRPIVLVNGNSVFIVRVPRSWNAPHVVDYEKHWRFYYRGSAGSYPMDITELRTAMISANTLQQRLEEFRFAQLAKIADDPALERGAKIVIHLQPLDSLREDFEVDLNKVLRDEEILSLLGADEEQIRVRRNFDGLLICNRQHPETGYSQVFRSGAIEKVEIINQDAKGPDYIPSFSFGCQVIQGIARGFAILQIIETKSPVMLHLSLLGVKNHKIWARYYQPLPRDLDSYNEVSERNPIDREDLLLRGLLVEAIPATKDLFQAAAPIVRPALDTIWNAAGFGKSFHYDRDGNWANDLIKK